MAIIRQWMNYSIVFTQEADYLAARALAGGGVRVQISPRGAAALFGIPFPYPTDDMDVVDKTIRFFHPFFPGEEIFYPGPSGIFVDDTIDHIDVPAQIGNPGGTFDPGDNCEFTWCGGYVKIDSAANPPGPLPTRAPIPQRKWINGFEWDDGHEGGGIGGNSINSRDASRTFEGCGLAIRALMLTNCTVSINTEFGSLTPSTWERFYIRFRALPTTFDGVGIWRCLGNPGTTVGYSLRWMLNGEVHGFTENAGVDKGIIFTPVLDVWYKIDIFVKYGAGTGKIKIFVNGLEIFEDTGILSTTNHATANLGRWNTTVGELTCEYDLDDWIGAELPANLNPGTLEPDLVVDYPIDWYMGSHIRKLFTVGGTSVDWTGQLATVNQGLNTDAGTALSTLISNTALAEIRALTDLFPQSIQDMPGALILGVAAIVVGTADINSGATSGETGINILGITDILLPQAQGVAISTRHVFPYNPSGMMIAPDEIFPLSVVHIKSNDVNQDITFSLVGTAEYIGYFGPEDDTENPASPVTRLYNLHNSQYALSPWANLQAVVAAPVFIVGGTYIGNDDYQEIILPAPCHFLLIRPVGVGGTGGLRWFGASLGAHQGAKEYIYPRFRIWSDFNGVVKFAVWGNNDTSNAIGVTYQYIAFCDPGGRFNLCGAFARYNNSPSPKIINLPDPDFIPEAMFGIKDTTGNTATTGLYYKGPGIGGNAAKTLENTVVANFGILGIGQLELESDTFENVGNWNWSLWRTSEPNCLGVMVQVCSYMGNGISPRNIDITPHSDRFPLFVLIVPTNAQDAYFRDVSHAVGRCSNYSTNADVAGPILDMPAIDTVRVDGILNTNGVIYDVFAFPGSDLGVLNGIYWNPVCEAPQGTYVDPIPLTGDIVQAGEGGIILGGVAPSSVLEDIGGIYTLVPNTHKDVLLDKLPGQTEIDFEIPDPTFKTGYIGG